MDFLWSRWIRMIVKIGQIGVYRSFFISLIYDTIKIEDEKTVICSRTSKNRGWITASSSEAIDWQQVESGNIMGEKESRSQGLIRFFLRYIPGRERVESRTWPLLDGGRGKRSSLLQLSQWRIDTRFTLLTNWSTLESLRRPRCFRSIHVRIFDYQLRSIIAQVSAENRVKLYRRFCLLLLRLTNLGSQRTYRC